MYNMPKTLLDDLSAKNIYTSPYPYLFIENALESEYCDNLVEKYPPLEVLAKDNIGRNNFRFNFTTNDVLKSQQIDPMWREFIKSHASQKFFHQFVDAFEPELIGRYSNFLPKIQDWKNLKIGIRNRDNFSTHDVLLDVQIAGNTPVTKVSSVRTRHIDDPRKLFGGLFYLRLDGDTSNGGDLEISRPKNKNFKYYNKVYVADKYAVTEKLVPYQRNNFVLFLNTPESWHGVTPRQITTSPRLFVNFIAEVKEPIFDIRAKQDKWDLLLLKLRLRKYSKYES
jgi:hypothetical protein